MWKNTKYEEIIKSMFDDTLKDAKIDVAFKMGLDEKLAKIQEDMNSENISEVVKGKKKKKATRQVLIDHIGSQFTELMERNKKKFKIRKELIENLKKAFGTCIVKGYL